MIVETATGVVSPSRITLTTIEPLSPTDNSAPAVVPKLPPAIATGTVFPPFNKLETADTVPNVISSVAL